MSFILPGSFSTKEGNTVLQKVGKYVWVNLLENWEFHLAILEIIKIKMKIINSRQGDLCIHMYSQSEVKKLVSLMTMFLSSNVWLPCPKAIPNLNFPVSEVNSLVVIRNRNFVAWEKYGKLILPLPFNNLNWWIWFSKNISRLWMGRSFCGL